MQLLLDTHILLLAAYEPKRLPNKAKTLLEDERNELFFSVASLWEIAIKNQLGRADFQVDLISLRQGLMANEYQELDITALAVLGLSTLEDHHKDAFDRLLIAQAKSHSMSLLTVDKTLKRYKNRHHKIILL